MERVRLPWLGSVGIDYGACSPRRLCRRRAVTSTHEHEIEHYWYGNIDIGTANVVCVDYLMRRDCVQQCID